MSTNHQNINTSEERVYKSEEFVHEPVAKVVAEISGVRSEIYPALPMGTKLYAAPPKREWQGLTHEELDLIYKQHHNEYGQGVTGQYERAIQAKLREKNT